MSKPSQHRTDTAALEIAAKPERIYDAFSNPEVLMRWLPPSSMTGRALEYDFREGGRYRIELTYEDDGPGNAAKTSDKTDVSSGRFVALERGKRIVQTVEFDSTDPAFAGEMTMTWSFDPAATGTRVTVTAENVPPGISKADHDEGLRASLANLGRHMS
jgi:uncharacterized protein YndB with AHSA1/START domain